MIVEQTMTLPQIESNLREIDFNRLRKIIYQQSGISLDAEKKTLLKSRLQKRLRALGITTYREYCEFVTDETASDGELQKMINRITTNKTHFYREEHHFDFLRDTVFPSLIQQARRGERSKQLRIWSAACSSGEEPYTLAMTIQESFLHEPGWDIKILASDIDTDVLEKAGTGIYHEDQVEDLPPQRVSQHFLKGTKSNRGKVQVRQDLRDMVTFAQINFADPTWPMKNAFDTIFCRNVLIYFDESTQSQLIRRFSNYLKTDGFLFIGHSESLGRSGDAYTRVGPTIFQLSDPTQVDSSVPSTDVKQRQPIPHQKKSATAPPKKNINRLIVGDVDASETQKILTTTVGSCIAVCLYDGVTRIGGMNHFALPVDKGGERLQGNYGVHAMELLINQMLKLGVSKKRLTAKVFGGAKLDAHSAMAIGTTNEQFIRGFLETEGIPIVAELLGGNTGIQVFFETSSGRARVRRLDNAATIEANKQSQTMEKPAPDITLF